jgi:hypothetical protein
LPSNDRRLKAIGGAQAFSLSRCPDACHPYQQRDWHANPPEGYVDAILYKDKVYGIKSWPIYINGDEITCLPDSPCHLWCPIHGDEELQQPYVEYGTWYIDRYGDSHESDYGDCESNGEPYCNACRSDMSWDRPYEWFDQIERECVDGVEMVIDLAGLPGYKG